MLLLFRMNVKYLYVVNTLTRISVIKLSKLIHLFDPNQSWTHRIDQPRRKTPSRAVFLLHFFLTTVIKHTAYVLRALASTPFYHPLDYLTCGPCYVARLCTIVSKVWYGYYNLTAPFPRDHIIATIYPTCLRVFNAFLNSSPLFCVGVSWLLLWTYTNLSRRPPARCNPVSWYILPSW